MCGINGFNRKSEALLREMNDCLKHRGPDFSGTYLDEKVSLGHTLLSIRERYDLSIQPYTKIDSSWVLLFNGQIYNTKEIKARLGDWSNNIDLDTALIYSLIMQYGWDFIHHIEGMYAIALYNKTEGIIRLYRDQSGQKLLYFYHKNDSFIFSSELKSILKHDTDKTIDEEAIIIATGLGYIPGQKTIFSHIKKLSPGSVVTYDINKHSLSTNFLKPSNSPVFSEKWEEAFDELISLHLQGKQEVAINLSGGLDSSLLLHEMSKKQHQISSFTTIFENAAEKFNRDAELAKKLAKDYGAKHHEIVINKKSYLCRIEKTLQIVEEPDFNISLPVYLETAEAEGINGAKLRVILSGNGGDEIFGGYPHYYESLRMQRFERLLTPWLFSFLKNKRNRTNRKWHDIDDRWLSFRTFTFRPIKTNDNILLPYIKTEMNNLKYLYEDSSSEVYETMQRDRLLWMPAENFLQADKIYMSQSVELRSPLSYQPFRKYADNKLKNSNYVTKDSNKVLLRRLYKDKLPDYIVERKDKTGWRSPIVDWYDESFKKLFLEILTPMKKNKSIINWGQVISKVENSEKWPGKQIHLYLSLACLSKLYKIEL